MAAKGGGDGSSEPLGDVEPPSMAVVEAIADLTDRDPVACPPLYDYVDPDALDRLVSHGGEVRIDFEYDGYEVEVSDETVTVRPS